MKQAILVKVWEADGRVIKERKCRSETAARAVILEEVLIISSQVHGVQLNQLFDETAERLTVRIESKNGSLWDIGID